MLHLVRRISTSIKIMTEPVNCFILQTYSDSESITDCSGVQEYMLQCCRTDNKGNSDSVFSTVYCGEESSHLVTDLEPHVSYTFRVCGRFGNEGKWGSWSIPRNGITTLDQHGKDEEKYI